MRRIAKNLTLCLSAEEYTALLHCAEEMDTKIEPTIRSLIAEAEVPCCVADGYSEILKELNKTGKQINQFALHANPKKSITQSEIQQACKLIPKANTLIESKF